MVQKVHKLESENFELNKQVEKIISGIEDQRRKHVKEVQYSRCQIDKADGERSL